MELHRSVFVGILALVLLSITFLIFDIDILKSNIFFSVFTVYAEEVFEKGITQRLYGLPSTARLRLKPVNSTEVNTGMDSISQLAKFPAKFIIGISNGHQGTTFLSSPSMYESSETQLSELSFFFEKQSICVQKPCHNSDFPFCQRNESPHPLRRWYKYMDRGNYNSQEFQLRLVEHLCIPHWQRRKAKKAIVLGHDTIFYFPGFKNFLNETVFIRIRRPRIETARSFTLSCLGGRANPILQFQPVGKDNCYLQVPCRGKNHENAFTYCPLENSDDVILRRPPSLWRNFSYFQRALWYIDELEAKWTRFLEINPGARYLETSWSSDKPEEFGAMSDAHAKIAQVLGLKPMKKTKVVKKHAPTGINENLPYWTQALAYAEQMRFSSYERSMIRKVQF